MILTDTGPMVAYVNANDPWHLKCIAAARDLPPGPFLTTWSCFTEAMHLLGRVGGYRFQQTLWRLRENGGIVFHDLSAREIELTAAFMAKYSDLPLDMADASLLAVSETIGTRQLFTFDTDFYILRLSDGSPLELIPQPPNR